MNRYEVIEVYLKTVNSPFSGDYFAKSFILDCDVSDKTYIVIGPTISRNTLGFKAGTSWQVGSDSQYVVTYCRWMYTTSRSYEMDKVFL